VGVGSSYGRSWWAACAAMLSALLASPGAGLAGPPQTSQSRVDAALENITRLDRPGEDGLAAVWDGNKYVQCRRMRDDRVFRCEAAGALMQPSLDHVLAPERIARLAALGWRLDPSFGNYVQVFPENMSASEVASKILQALAEGYDADLANLEVRSDWISSQPCPPRNGPTQNLAGLINDAPAMAATAIHACAYTPPPSPSIRSAADLVGIYGTRVTGEVQRLRINLDRRVFFVLETGAGYVQCEPQTSPDAIYCEAQSADSWAILASVLTSERVARLHAAGFFDPGRAPNYWRTYPLGEFDDAAIARELLTILYDVYGYRGSPKLKLPTEKGGN
jgi:hypothetical protein